MVHLLCGWNWLRSIDSHLYVDLRVVEDQHVCVSCQIRIPFTATDGLYWSDSEHSLAGLIALLSIFALDYIYLQVNGTVLIH